MTNRTILALLGAAALLGCASEPHHYGPEWEANCAGFGVPRGDPRFMQCMEHQQVITAATLSGNQAASVALTGMGLNMLASPAATGYVSYPQQVAPRPTSCSINAGFLNCQ